MKSVQEARADAQAIFRAGIARVDPVAMVQRAVTIVAGDSGPRLLASAGGVEAAYDLSRYDRVFATGMGKATARMAAGLEHALGDRLSGGLIAVKKGHAEPLSRIRTMEAGHPLPDDSSVAAAQAILDLGASMGTRLTERDLVIVLVSGGGSSILCAPAEGLSLEDKIATTKLLLASGANINEINCVRKHLSAVKGGRLAAALAPATVLTLVLSDVVGDDLDAIASGPTVPDPTSYKDAQEILARYGIADRLPSGVARRIASGVAASAGSPSETPKPGDPIFSLSKTVLIGTNKLAVQAAAEEAGKRGYATLALSSRVTGESREVAQVFLGIGKDMAASGMPLTSPACVIAGGETTVTLKGNGKGGRNQEMALAFLASLGRAPKDGERLVFLSGGTDGNDGPTDAAGAIADVDLLATAREAGINPEAALANNDAYTFFDSVGGLIKTGPTNTNVCDIQVLIAR
ncbi:MAG: glycerate kinase [Spirochaetales bacterium]|nr:glycerate kinase [Spirochaetales bacterium]